MNKKTDSGLRRSRISVADYTALRSINATPLAVVDPLGGTVIGRRYDRKVNVTIELDREEDGRWIAETLELPGVMCYGQTRDEAISNTERLVIEVIADRIAHGELPSSSLSLSFSIPDERLARQ